MIERKKIIIQDLVFFRDKHSDEIPPKIVRGNKIENRVYKVRRNWFNGVFNVVVETKRLGLINDPATLVQIDEFLTFIKNDFAEDGEERLTTAEDIKRANNIINKVLESLGHPPKT